MPSNNQVPLKVGLLAVDDLDRGCGAGRHFPIQPIELAQERVLRKLEPRKGHSEAHSDEQIDVPFATQKTAHQCLNLYGIGVFKLPKHLE